MLHMADGFKPQDTGLPRQLNHRHERLSGETLSPCILRKYIASQSQHRRPEREPRSAQRSPFVFRE
jgi:hypothetical protein